MTTMMVPTGPEALKTNSYALLRVASRLKGTLISRYSSDCRFFEFRPKNVAHLFQLAAGLDLSGPEQHLAVKRWCDHLVSSTAESIAVELPEVLKVINGKDRTADIFIGRTPVDLKVTSVEIGELRGRHYEDVIRALLERAWDGSRERHQNKAFLVIARPPRTTPLEGKANLFAVRAAVERLMAEWPNLERLPLDGSAYFAVVVVVDGEGRPIELQPGSLRDWLGTGYKQSAAGGTSDA